MHKDLLSYLKSIFTLGFATLIFSCFQTQRLTGTFWYTETMCVDKHGNTNTFKINLAFINPRKIKILAIGGKKNADKTVNMTVNILEKKGELYLVRPRKENRIKIAREKIVIEPGVFNENSCLSQRPSVFRPAYGL